MAERTMGQEVGGVRKVDEAEQRLNEELKAAGMGIKDLDSFAGSAEEALEKIRAIICSLTELTSELNSETLKANPVVFQKTEEAIEMKKAEFEVMYITFRAQVEIQYPHVPISQKIAVFILGMLRGAVREPVMLQTFGGNKRKRKMLLEAGIGLEAVMREAVKRMTEKAKVARQEVSNEKYQAEQKVEKEKRDKQEAIEKKKKAFVEMRTAEILRQDKVFQEIIANFDNAVKEFNSNRSGMDQKTQYTMNARIEDWKTKKERKEKEARGQAEAEAFRGEDSDTPT